MYIFISHSSNEANIAKQICDALEQSGKECFIAPRDIRSGYPYAEEITGGIDRSDAMILILSKAANQSPHVLREVERAVTKSIPIIVYKVEDVELTKSMEYFLMTHQWMEPRDHNYKDVVAGVDNLNQEMVEKPKLKQEQTPPSSAGNRKPWAVGVALLAAVLAVVFIICLSKSGEEKPAGDGSLLVSAGDAIVVPDSKDVHLGDTITMGTYNQAPIQWRVLHISEDGSEAVVVAKDVLTVKAFDAPDSGRYNEDGTENYGFDEEKLKEDMELQAYVRGNSSWENSNIRTWLNSASENVKYEGQAPVSSAMADGVNGYNTEKGFLTSFTAEELDLIVDSQVETKANALGAQEAVVTTDKVFLLSLEELSWFEEADVSLTAVPTPQALANDKSSWYNDYCVGYGVEATMWWLREPVNDSASKCYLVGNGYYEENIYTWEVGVESFGIRPAMRIQLQ